MTTLKVHGSSRNDLFVGEWNQHNRPMLLKEDDDGDELNCMRVRQYNGSKVNLMRMREGGYNVMALNLEECQVLRMPNNSVQHSDQGIERYFMQWRYPVIDFKLIAEACLVSALSSKHLMGNKK